MCYFILLALIKPGDNGFRRKSFTNLLKEYGYSY